LRDRPPYHVNLPKVMPKMHGVLAECIALLQQQEEPEVFISRQRCNLCRWYTHCYALAQLEQHLSLIPGVSPSRYSYLQSLNLTTLESLAGANVDSLEPTIERDIAIQLIRQAQSVLQNQVILSDTPPFAADALPTAPIELYFDIEAEPDINLDYLLGVLVVDRQAKTEKFYPFLAERPEDESLIWEQFLELVSSYPDAPIFHFCDYEVETVKRLAKCYKTPYERVKPILARFVDIHERVKQAVTLPVQSYALKHIARWLGFEWQNPKANGQLCIYWYDQWLKVSDRSYLDAILRYNEDDCRATLVVKDWLVNLIEDYLQNPA
ncbi:MAG TPA: recombinase B, partial [Cyanobacteria bacterium UBA11369]|nr:recombinase B [Cyanobacteria bacterium UBA11369]